MLDKRLFSSKLNILYAVFKGISFSSNITDKLSPFFTSWKRVFFTFGNDLLKSFVIDISSMGTGLFITEST